MSATRASTLTDPSTASGDPPRAADPHFEEVYARLKALAGSYLRRERAGHTLQPTALVNEAYLRMRDVAADELPNRGKFLAIAARAMRQVLIDSARRRQADKRRRRDVTLDEDLLGKSSRTVEILALDEALRELAKVDDQRARIVELRFFVGLSCKEAAEVLGVSSRTVIRQWRSSRAFLLHRLG